MTEKLLNDLDNSNAEIYRRKLIAVEKENQILRENVRQLQEQLQYSYTRIDELIKKESFNFL
jgi:predicted nuclease with TOPRIM domain